MNTRHIKRRIQKLTLSRGEVKVLYMLSLMCRIYENVYPSHAYIAKCNKLTRRHIIRIIKSLKEKGYIVTKQFGKTLKYISVIYEMLLRKIQNVTQYNISDDIFNNNKGRYKKISFKEPPGRKVLPLRQREANLKRLAVLKETLLHNF